MATPIKGGAPVSLGNTNAADKVAKPATPSKALADFDFNQHIIDQMDRSLWAALFDGHYRLAVRCDVCGRWLTSSVSKRAHRGPRCAARAGDEQ